MAERENRAGSFQSEFLYLMTKMVVTLRHPADQVKKDDGELVQYTIKRAIDECRPNRIAQSDASFTFIVTSLRGSLALQAFELLQRVSS